jgi:hypothetical protein
MAALGLAAGPSCVLASPSVRTPLSVQAALALATCPRGSGGRQPLPRPESSVISKKFERRRYIEYILNINGEGKERR